MMDIALADQPAHFEQTISDAERVRHALIARGLETPMLQTALTLEEKHQRISSAFHDIVATLGLDIEDDSLRDTPNRIAKMYLQEIFSGLDYANFPKMSSIENKMGLNEMVLIDDISLISTCEHHFVTIDGSARVAYIPEERVIGLSKINRIVRFFATRPQVQERLTQQVLVSLQTLLETDNVAVSIKATHYCVKARGVMDLNSSTSTTSMGGKFRDCQQTRAEFLR